MKLVFVRLMVPLLACGLTASACGSSSDASLNASSEDSTMIGFASPVASQPSVALVGHGMKEAAESIGWHATVFDANLDPNAQVSNIQSLIQQDAGAIASWTLDAGATAGIYAQADQANIPIIGVNSEGSGVKYAVWNEIQQCSPGGPAEQTADLIASKFPDGNVVTIGLDVVPSWASVADCFEKAAKQAGLTILAHQSNNSDDTAGAQKLTADMLTKYPDVNAIWAYNDASALGASAAVIAAGKTVSDGESDGIIITGENGDSDAIQAVRDGRLTGTWDLNMVEFGWLIVKTAEDALKEGTAPAKTVLRSSLWTANNIDDYVPPKDRDVSFEELDIVAE